MKKASVIVMLLVVIALVIGGAVGFFAFIVPYQAKRLEGKTRRLKELQETFVPVRFRLLERSDSSIKAEFRFYSMIVDNIEAVDMEVFSQGKEVAPPRIIEIEGSELFIDSVKIPNGSLLPYDPDAVWVFPYRIFSDVIAPEHALPIYTWYNDNGFPAIYNALDLEEQDKAALSRVYADMPKSDAGNALHDMSRLVRFRLNVWYDVVAHVKKGGLEIIGE
ncbi:MAG: hypothetical protein LBD58_04210 [Treponema sp.]|jgi:hypothetical protein|nr:hypothetical protein [Treponema sp.]